MEPAWEYMHFHPYLQEENLYKIGIWEKDGDIVAMTHYESHLRESFFQFHPDYRHLRDEILAYAESALVDQTEKNSEEQLYAFDNDNDMPFTELVKMRGYVHNTKEAAFWGSLLL